MGVIGRELAAPGSTARLAVIELAVILANMLLVVSLIYPLYPYYHTISLYYVAIFSLVPLLRLSLARSFAAIALPGLALLVGILHQEPLAPINLSNAINLVAMTVLTLVSMRYLHAERVRDLLQQDIIARQQAELGRQALTDALTGLANRRCLDAALAREWRNTAREGVDLSAVMIDIDYFKQFNDTSGHAAGDACLRLVAGCIARHLRRAGDMAARYGGEEFLVLLPGVDRDEARILAEAIRREILDANLPHPGSPFARVSVSLGVASRGPDAQDTPQALLARADAALYAAKADGRNRVRLAEADPAH